MEPDDEIKDIIYHTVKDSKRRIVLSADAPMIHEGSERAGTAMIGGEEVILVPDPDEVVKVQCANCEKPFMRPLRVIERDTRRHGAWTCNKTCRKEQEAKKERNFNPDRENTTTTEDIDHEL